MQKVICKKGVSAVLTLGKEYDVVEKDGDNIIVIDDEGVRCGFSAHRFTDLDGNPLNAPVITVIKEIAPVEVNPLDIVPREGEFFSLQETVTLVKKLFRDKHDIGGQPYFYHLRHVGDACKVLGEDFQIVGLLHDILEDIPFVSVAHLQERFPEHIVNAVCVLTKKKGCEYQDYIREVSENPIACRVKIEDLRHNMDITRLPTLGNTAINRLRKYHTAFQILVSSL